MHYCIYAYVIFSVTSNSKTKPDAHLLQHISPTTIQQRTSL